MSNKEKVISLLDTLPDYKIAFILAFAQGVAVSDESDDDMFCQKLVDDFLNDNDPTKHETISIEELAKELDISLWDMK